MGFLPREQRSDTSSLFLAPMNRPGRPPSPLAVLPNHSHWLESRVLTPRLGRCKSVTHVCLFVFLRSERCFLGGCSDEFPQPHPSYSVPAFPWRPKSSPLLRTWFRKILKNALKIRCRVALGTAHFRLINSFLYVLDVNDDSYVVFFASWRRKHVFCFVHMGLVLDWSL